MGIHTASLRFLIRKGLMAALLWGAVTPTALLRAQTAPSGPEMQRLLRQMNEVPAKVATRDFAGALALLEQAMPVMQPLIETDPNMKIQYGFALYVKGVCHIETQDYKGAEEVFTQFLQLFPNDANASKARLLLGESLLMQEKWHPILQIIPPIVNSRTTPFAELMLGHQLMGEARFQLEQWEEAMPHLQWLYRNAPDQQLRFAAAGQMAICMIRLERFADLYRVMPHLHRTDARYDIGLNLAMLEEGDRFLQDDRPDLALLMYRLVVPYAELTSNVLRQLEQTRKIIEDLKRAQVSASADNRNVRELERRVSEMTLKQEELSAYPDYDLELRVRLGDVYSELERWEEAIQVYLSLRQRYPKHELAERGLYSAFLAAFHSGDPLRAWDIAQEYIAAYPGGEYWDDITLQSAALLADLSRWFETVELVDKALSVHPEHASIDNLLFLKGYAQFQMNQIRESMESFRRLTRDHSRSAFLINAEYWLALGHLFLQEYPQARDAFKVIVDRGRGGPLREDGYYRLGQAEYGLGDFEAAKRVFEAYIAEFPDAEEGSSALAMIGDIYASWGKLDEAIAAYRMAADKSRNMVQADYATFQQARTFELERRWQDIIDLFDDYKTRHSEEEANYTEATYWTGNALKQLGKHKEALDLFYDAIVKHGNDRKAYGIDFILRDLLEEIRSLGGQNALALELRDRLNQEVERAHKEDKKTLLLRLEGLQYQTSTNEELRTTLRERLMHPDNIAIASPISLELLGQLGQETHNLEYSRSVYETFLGQFEDSDLILNALVGLSEVRVREEKLVEAMDLLKSITDRFPTTNEAAEAWMRMGDIHRMRKEFDKAEEVYTLILSVKDWRGELWPRALLKLGDTHNEAGNADKAFGFYQRVYVLYLGYPEQASVAYFRSAQMLDKLGRRVEARKTLTEMLEQPSLASRPIAQDARAMITRLPQ